MKRKIMRLCMLLGMGLFFVFTTGFGTMQRGCGGGPPHVITHCKSDADCPKTHICRHYAACLALHCPPAKPSQCEPRTKPKPPNPPKPGPTCKAQDAKGVGLCEAFFGYAFDGKSCQGLSGCRCQGADCKNLFKDKSDCLQVAKKCTPPKPGQCISNKDCPRGYECKSAHAKRAFATPPRTCVKIQPPAGKCNQNGNCQKGYVCWRGFLQCGTPPLPPGVCRDASKIMCSPHPIKKPGQTCEYCRLPDGTHKTICKPKTCQDTSDCQKGYMCWRGFLKCGTPPLPPGVCRDTSKVICSPHHSSKPNETCQYCRYPNGTFKTICKSKQPGTCKQDNDCSKGYLCEHYSTCKAMGCPPPPPSKCVKR